MVYANTSTPLGGHCMYDGPRRRARLSPMLSRASWLMCVASALAEETSKQDKRELRLGLQCATLPGHGKSDGEETICSTFARDTGGIVRINEEIFA